MAERDAASLLDDPASREARAVFLMRLRRAGVRDLAVLRAIEETPRHLFTPQRYRDLAFRELRLPLPCGQTMPDAVHVARLVEAAECGPRMRLLEIGAGSGYVTAVLARLCGEVIALERFRSLVVEAQARLDALGLTNVLLRWADGAEPAGYGGPFDRIVIHAVIAPQMLARHLDALAPGGVLIAGESDAAGRVTLARYDSPAILGDSPRRRALGPARLRALDAGLAQAL